MNTTYILTTTDPQGDDPSPDSVHWTVRSYHQPSYGAVGNIILEGVPVLNVAVLSKNPYGLGLAEVKVYSYGELHNILMPFFGFIFVVKQRKFWLHP